MQTTYTEVTAKPDSLEVLLTNLNPGTTYEIKVKSVLNHSCTLHFVCFHIFQIKVGTHSTFLMCVLITSYIE